MLALFDLHVAEIAYDGEGRLCAVKQQGSGSVTQYFYDASGRRVAKGALSSGSFPAANAVCAAPVSGQSYSSLYLMNLAGEQVTELTGAGGWVHTNVWSGAHLSATYDMANGGALHFHVSDPLGTRRVQVNATGQIEESCESLPFGENLSCATTSIVTADDATEHHFTGKERDQESGNDYFGARYYASTMGRFLSPDWSAKVEPVPYSKLDNPQTLNLYSYVLNNPLISVDTDGHVPLSWGGFEDCSERNDCGTVTNFESGLEQGMTNAINAALVAKEEKANETLLAKMIFSESTNLSDAGDQQNEMAAVGYSATNRVNYFKNHPKARVGLFGAKNKSLSGVIVKRQFASFGGPQWRKTGNLGKLNQFDAAKWSLSASVAKGIFQGTVEDPYAKQGGTYGFRTKGSGSPGGNFFNFDSQIDGSNNTFYGLKSNQ